MIVSTKTGWPLRAGRVMAGVAAAWLLAGCGGGGGGGGGGGSTPNPPNNTPPTIPTPFASGTAHAGQSTRIYNPSNPASNSPEIDVAPDAVPSSNTSGITISMGIDTAPPSTNGYTLNSDAIYDIEKPGTTFAGSGITIKLPVTSPVSIGSGAALPLIYAYDPTTGQWQVVTDSSGNVSDNYGTSGYVTVQTNSIATGRGSGGIGPTDYAVLTATIAPPPSTPSAR